MRHTNTIFFRLAFAIIILLAVMPISALLIIMFSDRAFANAFRVNLLSSLWSFLFLAAISFSVVLCSSIRDRWKIYRLFQTTVDKPIVIYASNIILPSKSAYTYNMQPLRFGGSVIAWQEYVAASQLSSFLEQDSLAGYPAFLKSNISVVFPEAKPFELQFRISPLDEYGIDKATSIISLGSPGSNFVTAYVSQYHPACLKFGTNGRSIEVARGTSGEVYSRDNYADLGIIQRVKLQDENMTVIILAGLTDLSTKMCVTYFINHWKEIDSEYRNDDFGICLAIPLKDPEAYDRPDKVCAYPKRS